MQGACGLVAGWAGQSGVLAPCDGAVVVALGLHRHFLPLATWVFNNLNSCS